MGIKISLEITETSGNKVEPQIINTAIDFFICQVKNAMAPANPVKTGKPAFLQETQKDRTFTMTYYIPLPGEEEHPTTPFSEN